MKLTAQDVALLNYAMNFRGDLNEKGQPIPRTHDQNSEKMFKDVTDLVNKTVKEVEAEKKKKKDTTPIAEVEIKFSLEQRTWLVQMMSIPWEASMFEAKNKLIDLLNE